ncbi:hypothetical protein DNU06_12030 [Putridiphycobacter roseus]|uniref:Uncharacterized protein n=1 Tax=Putridiphycobacter roseus TaxID=2219161 RepID=A0A2W1NET9_9FLAO|nr:hypothetical protein [Putridiphycobacter roseus]PZE16576.1 hypothetical protein DNU06_12030 [Putridiphycobacter roseus]
MSRKKDIEELVEIIVRMGKKTHLSLAKQKNKVQQPISLIANASLPIKFKGFSIRFLFTKLVLKQGKRRMQSQ